MHSRTRSHGYPCARAECAARAWRYAFPYARAHATNGFPEYAAAALQTPDGSGFYLDAASFAQMCGRAGRPGQPGSAGGGDAILMVNAPRHWREAYARAHAAKMHFPYHQAAH